MLDTLFVKIIFPVKVHCPQLFFQARIKEHSSVQERQDHLVAGVDRLVSRTGTATEVHPRGSSGFGVTQDYNRSERPFLISLSSHEGQYKNCRAARILGSPVIFFRTTIDPSRTTANCRSVDVCVTNEATKAIVQPRSGGR